MRIGNEGPRFELEPPNLLSAGPGAPERASPAETSAFSKAFRGIGKAVDHGERLIASAAHGNLGGLDSAQLIALQAGIYRYSEAVDLVAKLVDRATNAVRTVVSPH